MMITALLLSVLPGAWLQVEPARAWPDPRSPEALTARKECQGASIEFFDQPALEETNERRRVHLLRGGTLDSRKLLGVSGNWLAWALVGTDGTVIRSWQVSSLGETADEALSEAVMTRVYRPVVVADIPIPACVPVHVTVRGGK